MLKAAVPYGLGFFTPFWRKTAIFSVLGYGLYQLLPTRATDPANNRITAFIQDSLTSAEVWKERNQNHLALTVDAAEHLNLTTTARRPLMRRVRYPGWARADSFLALECSNDFF